MPAAGRRFEWKGELSAGQYFLLWPGEPPQRYGPAFTEPMTGPEPVPSATIPEGEYTVQFGHTGTLVSPGQGTT